MPTPENTSLTPSPLPDFESGHWVVGDVVYNVGESTDWELSVVKK